MAINIISWNVRGMCNSDRRGEMRRAARGWKPNILILQETKIKNWTDRMVNQIGDFGDFGWFFLPSRGRSGGILML
ncbi:hypothetical protein BVC80_8593g15 [Macleaya cordata]|uniref:Endonuclease/exonuclease/phosphatase n=1 Tax=Macleaya cordata TaxID=56857 RepID=A0A200PP98_MACCD|nr:hypothetical protein BVC80_8593g15 [Macleaya cordata]